MKTGELNIHKCVLYHSTLKLWEEGNILSKLF